MASLTLIVPAAYVAALAVALSGDFLRAQLAKDLEHDPPGAWARLAHAVSLPTVCLIAALLIRLVVDVEGLLLTALFVVAALSVWKTYRLWVLSPPRPADGRRL